MVYFVLIGCIALLGVHLEKSFVSAAPSAASEYGFPEQTTSAATNLNGDAQDAAASINNPESACPCLTSVNNSTIPGQSDWLTQQRRQHLEQFYSQNVMMHGMMCTCNVAMRGAPMRDDYRYSVGIGAHKLHTRAATWNDARKFCNEEGGHLAVINSIAEAHVLLEIFNRSGPIKGAAYPDEAFLGIHDLYKEGEWVTVLGDSLAKTGYTRWSDKWGGQPDNGGGKQHCGALMKEGGMDDVACDVPFPFLCELPLMQLFVPWSSEFDKVILKKTTVMFRMLDEEWTSLSPNRHDHRPYRGSSYENENFYGGISVVFCVPEGFFKKKADGIDIQFYVRKEVCKYFEMDSCQSVGFAAVPVDDLLNSIAKQIREREELAEHLSDFYKRQIISRSTTGTCTLLDENFRNTAATISLYIRISYFGRCLTTEITRVESIYRAFCARAESDEEQPYLSRQLTPEELQSGLWDDAGLPCIPRGRLICRCEELEKKTTDLAMTRGSVIVGAAIATTTAIADATQDVATIAMKTATVNVTADSAAISVAKVAANATAIERGKAPADMAADSAAIPIVKVAADAVAIKRGKLPADVTVDPAFAISVTKDATDTAIKKRKVFADVVADPAAIFVTKDAKRATVIKRGKAPADVAATDFAAISVAKNATAIKRRKAPAAYGVLGNKIGADADVAESANAHKRITVPLMAINDEVINGNQRCQGRCCRKGENERIRNKGQQRNGFQESVLHVEQIEAWKEHDNNRYH